ncbi:hypothetical protein HYPSUDRAFT_145981 [Hypholoma sublateritium FD-334 SS-4]|uniref:Major facilitator superfamily (MFS) profile domain-containing protein n=1 Tax=Hypholoma sublateritium (strain FD-334 SS-4) TaxID=945553 RepID=A0A0D2NM96_HYPSF|nr:hypothetical protein HYPSUDRAFT_145981 [Hypholoma sublateritium FD-334 SS-4]
MAAEPENSPPHDAIKRIPLPLSQLFSVSLIQIAEPITAICIFPFINQFIRETGITGGDERKTGYYGGIIESTFFLSESLTVVTWGLLSDRYGRRPILLIAPLGLTAAMLIFGLSTTFWPLVFARSLQGIFNGNIGVTRSVIAEVTDFSNRADAFAIGPLIWSLGSTSAQLMGGFLSNPSKRWPNGIGRIPLLQKHPYLLPCGVAASLSFLAFIVAFLLLKESLPSLVTKEKQRKHLEIVSDDGILAPTEASPLLGDREEPQALSSEGEQSPNDDPAAGNVPQFRDVLIRPIMLAVMCNAFLMFIDMCHCSLLPLMWSTSIPLGGLGLDPYHIGATMGTYGIINAVFQINFMGRILRRLGTVRAFRASICSYLVCFAMYPLMSHFARAAGRLSVPVILCMGVQLCCQATTYFAFGSIQIIVVESVPPGGPMGTANGLAQMAGSGTRTIAPTLATSLFALSLQRNLAGGNLVYFICIGITFVGIYGASYLPSDKPRQGAGERQG